MLGKCRVITIRYISVHKCSKKWMHAFCTCTCYIYYGVRPQCGVSLKHESEMSIREESWLCKCCTEKWKTKSVESDETPNGFRVQHPSIGQPTNQYPTSTCYNMLRNAINKPSFLVRKVTTKKNQVQNIIKSYPCLKIGDLWTHENFTAFLTVIYV